MRKSRFSAPQIVGVLKEQKAALKAAVLCRKTRKKRIDAVQLAFKVRRPRIGDLMRLRQLEDENRRLKKIAADQALNIDALNIVAEGNF